MTNTTDNTATLNVEIREDVKSWVTDMERAKNFLGARKQAAFVMEIDTEVEAVVVLDRSTGDFEVHLTEASPADTRIEYDGDLMPVVQGPFGCMTAATDLDNSENETTVLNGEGESEDDGAAAAVAGAAEAVKSRAKKGSKKASVKAPAKPKRVRLSSREKLLKRLVKNLGVEIPETSQMFRNMDSEMSFVPLSRLALFINSTGFPADGSETVRALHELTSEFGADNILNLAAEVNPARVREVAESLIQDGELFEPITVAKLLDAPENQSDLDLSVYQIVSGRHRVASLAMIYGPEVEIPVRIQERDFRTAARHCLKANDTRDLGKNEKVWHDGLMAELLTESPEAAYLKQIKSSRNKAMAITKFAAYHAVTRRDDLFKPSTMRVTERPQAGSYSVSVVSWQNSMKEVIAAMMATMETRFEGLNTAKGIITHANSALNALYNKLGEIAQDGGQFMDPGKAWTAYGSAALGKLVGSAMKAAVQNKKKFEPEAVGNAIATAVAGFLRTPEGVTEFNQTPALDLVRQVRAYAAENDLDLPSSEDEGAADTTFSV